MDDVVGTILPLAVEVRISPAAAEVSVLFLVFRVVLISQGIQNL